MDYQKQGNDFLAKHKVKLTITLKSFAPYFQEDTGPRNIYSCTFRRGIKRFSITFGASMHMTEKDIKPTAYDILTCIQKNDPESFKDFCSNYGYNEDSRKAEKIYKACLKQWAQVKGFFTKKEIKELNEIN